MHDDSTPQERALAARRAQARQRRIYRRRRSLAALGATVALVAVIVAGSALLGGGGPSSAPTTPVAVVHATTAHGLTVHQKQAKAVIRTLNRMPLVAVAGRKIREIALTFDDGPGPYTLQVAKALEQMKVPATFFQVGQAVQVFTDAERAQLRNKAFVVGDHSETHPHLSALTRAGQIAEIDDAASVIKDAGGRSPRLFRPPFGAFDHTTLDLLARRQMLMVFWTIDSQDYTRPGVANIVRRVVNQARPGAIVLMHDAGGDRSQTVAALPKIIRQLRAKHYKLVTVPRLLLDNPPPLKQPAMTVGVG